MFSMEEGADNTYDSKIPESDKPGEGFSYSQSVESRKSVMRKRTRKKPPVSNEDIADADNTDTSETDSENRPTEA